MKTAVVIGRKWDNPNIQITVSDEEIGIRIDLQDFLHALSEEVGNPASILTVAALEHRLKVASDKVVHAMKQETARVM